MISRLFECVSPRRVSDSATTAEIASRTTLHVPAGDHIAQPAKESSFAFLDLPQDCQRRIIATRPFGSTSEGIPEPGTRQAIRLGSKGLRDVTPRFKKLRIAYTQELPEALKLYPDVEELALTNCRSLSNDHLAMLGNLTALQHLDLSKCYFLTDADLEHLNQLTKLQHLNLSYCSLLSDAGLAHLSRLTALRHLNLNWCVRLSDEGLVHLSQLLALERLELSRCTGLSDTGLTHLSPLTALQHLDLSYCLLVNPRGLSPLTALQHLNLSCSFLTDLSPLSPLTALRYLDLSNCKLVDDVNLMHLSRSTTLRHLDLRKSRLNAQDIFNLKKSLADCRVITNEA